MRPRGFSLLEVMVAVAILGLTLTVILSAQGGLAASNKAVLPEMLLPRSRACPASRLRASCAAPRFQLRDASAADHS